MRDSILTIVEPAKSRDLTTLAIVKDELNIKDNASNARLARWIKEASGAAEVYCNRAFGLETLSELFRRHGFGGGAGHNWREPEPITLRRFPIVAINSIVEDDGAALTADDYEFDPETGRVWRLSGQVNGVGGCRVPWHAVKTVFGYPAGYDLPDAAPFNLARACQALVTLRWNARGRDPTLRAETVPGVLERQWWVPSVGQPALPPEICELLDHFREINV